MRSRIGKHSNGSSSPGEENDETALNSQNPPRTSRGHADLNRRFGIHEERDEEVAETYIELKSTDLDYHAHLDRSPATERSRNFLRRSEV